MLSTPSNLSAVVCAVRLVWEKCPPSGGRDTIRWSGDPSGCGAATSGFEPLPVLAISSKIWIVKQKLGHPHFFFQHIKFWHCVARVRVSQTHNCLKSNGHFKDNPQAGLWRLI
jgi:hypothetical protein